MLKVVQIEKYIREEAPHKHLVFVLNKCDLVPTGVAVSFAEFLFKPIYFSSIVKSRLLPASFCNIRWLVRLLQLWYINLTPAALGLTALSRQISVMGTKS